MKNLIDKIKKFTVKNRKWIILTICLILFFVIVINVWNNKDMKLDIKGYDFISKYLIKDVITPIAIFITNFAGPICLIIVSIVLSILIKNKKIGITIWLNLLLSVILNLILKEIFQRPRPEINRLIEEWGYSLPSGHSMVSMAFYGWLMYLSYKFIEKKYLKWSLIVLLGILIIIIGISRIYLGVHYTTDVLGGFLVSIAYLMAYIGITKKFILKDKSNEKNK